MGPNPKPRPPLPGGEHVQFIDTGPQGVSPNATRVSLVPVGDRGPGPLLPRVAKQKKPKPLLPTEDEIAALPLGARVAFAQRCSERVHPIFMGGSGSAGHVPQGAAEAAADAGWLAAETAHEGQAQDKDAATASAANTVRATIFALLMMPTHPVGLTFIRRDFERVAKLARRNGWTDDTPVPPDVFGPLWPPGREPEWAREK